MKTLLTVLTLLVIVPQVALADWEITPQIPDLFSGDGICEEGTNNNPYIIKDNMGNNRGTIQPKYPDIFPGDGIGEAGTNSNPYIIDWD